MNTLRCFWSSLLIASILATAAYGGTYNGVVDCSTPPLSQDMCIQGETEDEEDGVTPFAIVHPLGYTGEETALEIRVCAVDAELAGPLKHAVKVWNSVLTESGNCQGCLRWEDDPVPAPAPYDIEFSIIHELGHCAMALDHPNLQFDPPGGADMREETSFTMSYGGLSGGIDVGIDTIRGSRDDDHRGLFMELADSVHWFRTADNDPVVFDAMVIDIDSYSRSVLSGLPPGDSWAASANIEVAESLGKPDTQSVMYSGQARRARLKALAPDDRNMLLMARTGVDLLADTEDDYTVTLTYSETCANADIRALYFNLGGGVLGNCDSPVAFSFPPDNPLLARHYSVVPELVGVPLELLVNNTDIAWGPILNTSGACPGSVTFTLTRATPNGQVVLVRGSQEGETSIPSGPCAGTLVDLESPMVLVNTNADGNGSLTQTATAPSSACGLPMQVVDVERCVVSNIANVP